MNDIRKLWLEAGKLFSKNPGVIITCPSCKVGRLKMKDEPIIEWKKIDRYIYCDACGKYNVLTMSNPDPMSNGDEG